METAITILEALRRVGLEALAPKGADKSFVLWRGQPSPFGSGCIVTRKGEVVKLSQHKCGGDVLFYWVNCDARGNLIRGGVGIAVDKIGGDTVLRFFGTA